MKSMCHEVAAQLAVGDGLQTGVALERDHVADRVVLDGPELVCGRAPGLEGGAGVAQAIGAQEAADVVGAERGTRTLSHARGYSRTGLNVNERWISTSPP